MKFDSSAVLLAISHQKFSSQFYQEEEEEEFIFRTKTKHKDE